MHEEFKNAILKTIAFHEQEIKKLRKLLDNTDSYAVKLSNRMSELNVTQTQLAKWCRVSQKTISRYCNGKVMPDEVMQKKINLALSTDGVVTDIVDAGPANPNEATFF